MPKVESRTPHAPPPSLREGEYITERALTGLVKFYDDKKGIGFIHCDDGREIYVHHTGLNTPRNRFGPGGKVIELQECDAVRFDIAEGKRGPKCVNVELL